MAAADIATTMLDRCDDGRLEQIHKHVAFLVPFACCCGELMARHSAAAVAVACVMYSARITGDCRAERTLIPAFIRAADGGAAALSGLRDACRKHGYDFGDAAAARRW